MSQRPAVGDFPRYGIALEKAGRIVGVLLTLYARYQGQDGEEVRCNLSSWSVDAEFRPYAMKLIWAVIRQRGVTFTNISPAPATLNANKAVGFRLFSNGQVAFLPAMNTARPSWRLLDVGADPAEMAMLSDKDRYILSEHAALGCLSLICVGDGQAFPFVLMPRRILHGLVPCGQVVYCRSLAELSQCAGTLGRFLLRRGILLCLVDAMEPVPGLFGRYFPRKGLKYFKGPKPPAAGDLTFTELVVFGP
ncbi:hypothetical protein [Mesorhizobium sp. B1-1-8]|uniref:hypothetical protein n=1 Tax=Mesorhizobium sp. B1-1-8 TaxID=2589976 RepID=UPI001D01506D|nr:hypothetical protein [Mesorhizobium sp. B1-1-8]UCI07129.1 hypothetical protein FJ974_25590 [Mesorhizobium sp. B1-1-8]